jgi:tetratricopeptide (TPR) repeat protein
MISRERWQRIEPILDVALDLPADTVATYLEAVWAREPDIREEAELLIAALDQSSNGFLDSPPTALATEVLSGPDPAASAEDVREGTEIGPYRVVRRLGSGGMGVVYLARDPRLDRFVALKLLPPWLASDESATRRLAEEAKAASALDHPNIETVYDIGHAEDGRPYIAMAYYEGETLKDRIRRGPLPVDEALTLATQLADGLAAAHGSGIVHRDIKPANVIVTPDGVAKIVDFGIAKVMGTDPTERGRPPGTVAYMSPEQTLGVATDSRTDVWSLGVVLYEMLAGRRPFSAGTSDAVISAIRDDEPEPLRRLRPDAPTPMVRVMDRCLSKEAESRYEDPAALALALRRTGERPGASPRWLWVGRRPVMLGVAIFLAASLIGASLQWPASVPGLARSRAYVEYLKGRYFLGKLEPGGTQAALDHFGRSLDLDPTFADAWSGLAGTYNQLVVQRLLAAHDGGPRAREAAERALELEPGLPEAHAHLAAVLSWYYGDVSEAERHFRIALELEPRSARAHRHYAVHLRNLGRFDEARAALRAASDVDPLSPGEYTQEMGILYHERRYEEAVAVLQRLLLVDPRHARAHFFLGLVRSQMGQYEEALAALGEADPEMRQPDALSVRGYVLARLGREEEAQQVLTRLDELSPGSRAFSKAVIHVGLGNHGRALDLLEEAVEARAYHVRLLKIEPLLDPLRSEPRFQTLLQKLNLAG